MKFQLWTEKCHDNDYEKLGDGVVLDKITDLIWSTKYISKEVFSAEMETTVAEIARKSKKPWHVPTIEEFASIMERVDPNIYDANNVNPIVGLEHVNSAITSDTMTGEHTEYNPEKRYYEVNLDRGHITGEDIHRPKKWPVIMVSSASK